MEGREEEREVAMGQIMWSFVCVTGCSWFMIGKWAWEERKKEVSKGRTEGRVQVKKGGGRGGGGGGN
jgi:hypothetical protein